MVYVTASRNFLLFIFEAIAEISSSKNKKSLSPFSEEVWTSFWTANVEGQKKANVKSQDLI